MSVDTYLKGKDLQPYRRADGPADLEVLVAPELYKLGATHVYILTKGAVFKKLAAALTNASAQGDSCSI